MISMAFMEDHCSLMYLVRLCVYTSRTLMPASLKLASASFLSFGQTVMFWLLQIRLYLIVLLLTSMKSLSILSE